MGMLIVYNEGRSPILSYDALMRGDETRRNTGGRTADETIENRRTRNPDLGGPIIPDKQTEGHKRFWVVHAVIHLLLKGKSCSVPNPEYNEHDARRCQEQRQGIIATWGRTRTGPGGAQEASKIEEKSNSQAKTPK